MKTKNIKRILTVVLATAMVFGCTLTAFAEDTPGLAEGTGTYEGGEMKYPTLQVTLPAIPAGTIDYIADPNGLIAATSAAHYADSEFDSSAKGIFFLTTPKTSESGSKNSYTGKSAAQELTNQNAQDIDVTVKLEQKTAGSESVTYSATDTFEGTDKKIYLALTDDAAQNPQTQALSATSAATLTVTVAGKPGNYKPNYENNKYEYKLKTKAENDDTDLTWNSCSFKLVGALNKNEGVKWEDGIEFPAIKVTWSYAEHTETPATSSAASIVVPESGNATLAITVGQDGAVPTSLTNTWFSGNMLQLTNGWGASYDASTKTITFADGISGDFVAEKAEALSATYTITFTPSEGDPYTQTVTFAE